MVGQRRRDGEGDGYPVPGPGDPALVRRIGDLSLAIAPTADVLSESHSRALEDRTLNH